MNIQEIKEKILNGIKYTTNAKGYTLVKSGWGSVEDKCACALSCLVLAEYDEKDIDHCRKEIKGGDIVKKAQQILQIDGSWISSFWHGFDGVGGGCNAEANQLGRDLAKELNPPRFLETRRIKAKEKS